MNTDDIRIPLRSMRDAFALTVAELTELRRYLAERYGDREPDPLAYLTKGRGSSLNDRNSYERGGDFWGAWHALFGVLEAYDAESDEVTEAVYEEALINGEPWAEEAYEIRQGVEPERP
jgi:hypothetical protein